VLVVDDDRGAGYESYYTAACDSVGVLHALWESATQGSVPAETLVEYPVVVWFCGDDSTTTLAPEERSALVTYFRDGGRLLLSGQGIARDLDNRQSPFLADYLHAEFVADSTGQQFLQGLDGDPITGGEFVVAGGSGGANNGWSLDGVRPITGAQTCARYLSYPDTTVAGIMRYQGTYQLVFMSVPFEAVDHSTSRYLQRWTLLARVLSWFGERLPGVEDAQPAAEAGPSRLMVAPTVARSLSDVRVTAPLNGPAEVAVVSADGRVLLRFTADVLAGRQLGLTAEGPGSGVYFVTVSGPGWRLTQRVTVIPR
jgi:hypothetical protein